MTELLPLVLSAFMAGLLGSGHCFAMCGGIASSLGVVHAGSSGRGGKGLLAALQFNLGRIAVYAGLGALLAAGAGWAGDLLQLQSWGRWLRILSAVLVAMVGLHYLVGWRGIGFIERAGARLWHKVSPLAVRASQRRDGAGRLIVGLCWGLLPCGLVYTLLATAASSGMAFAGAIIMLAFGIGTLPSMLGLTLAAPALSSLLSDKDFRRLVGFFLLLLAAWMLFTTFTAVSGHHGNHGNV